MVKTLDHIYSATYSNVPVFEFVTEEGPVMRRKSDSWINATHILKIAKFPKARRTRILEKDVQTGIHEKVQGGYGKYQGTYVPLELGAEIAKGFGVYETLRPIFEFQYIEGKSETPPPAPKHSHASASNVARRQTSRQKIEHPSSKKLEQPLFKRERDAEEDESGNKKKSGQMKRATLTREKPTFSKSETAPIHSSSPNFGTFTSRDEGSFIDSSSQLPPLMRQDTESDAYLLMASNMNVRRDDLEHESSEDELVSNGNHEMNATSHPHPRDSDEEELMTGKELFGSRDFLSRDSFGSNILRHNRANRGFATGINSRLTSFNGSNHTDSSGLHAFAQNSFNQNPQKFSSTSLRGDEESLEYFNALLNYFLEEKSTMEENSSGKLTSGLPEKILRPPQPLDRVNIKQPIDNDGNTIFHWACAMANVSMVEFLLSIFSSYIDSGVKNHRGETALMFMVQFNNSYQIKNFPAILDLLVDSVLAIDFSGRTVLHHIALACTSNRNESPMRTSSDLDSKLKKERFSQYYFDIIFSKIIEFSDYQLLRGDGKRSPEDKKSIISNFINHQDKEDNTALHIFSYNLLKKCIKIFIRHHKYIEFSLRNKVGFTAEDYLASHNYVLRLENDGDKSISTQEGYRPSGSAILEDDELQSFESQVQHSKAAMSVHNATVQLITGKFGELSYAIDRELRERDDKIMRLQSFKKVLDTEKSGSQKMILQLFNLEYLLEDLNGEHREPDTDADLNKATLSDKYRDDITQDEINRLNDDMCFQALTVQEAHEQTLLKYLYIKESLARGNLSHRMGLVKKEDTGEEALDLACKLQKAIMHRIAQSRELASKEAETSLQIIDSEEFKENLHGEGEELTVRSESGVNGRSEDSKSIISRIAPNDKLYKYCKLIALSCSMSFSEVENSIDLIEQSLAKAST